MVNEPFLLSAFVLKASQSEVQPNFFSLHFDYESSHLFVIFPTLFPVFIGQIWEKVYPNCACTEPLFSHPNIFQKMFQNCTFPQPFFSRISFHQI